VRPGAAAGLDFLHVDPLSGSERIAPGVPVILPRWLLRIFFHLLYNRMAWTYDGVAWLVSLGQWSSWRRTILPFLKDGPVLELAFGSGGLMADLTEKEMMPVGIDLSPYMVRITRKRLASFGYPFRLVQGRAQHLPFPDAVFSNVIATFPTDFFLDPDTLLSVRRILEPGGRLLIVAIGELRGPRVFRQPLEFAYHVTGQRQIPQPDPAVRLETIGFSAGWHDATMDGALARILIATRL
jgi:SAM-dependent methyltransferase